jgi:hypothetical protein
MSCSECRICYLQGRSISLVDSVILSFWNAKKDGKLDCTWQIEEDVCLLSVVLVVC